MGMEKLTTEGENIINQYDLDALRRQLTDRFPEISGTTVDVSIEANHILLTFAGNTLIVTPEQAADLLLELRRAIVKIKPSVLRSKNAKKAAHSR